MQWYNGVLNELSMGKTYSHRALVDKLNRIKPNLHTSTYHWAINGLLKAGSLMRKGYNEYVLMENQPKPEYHPNYSSQVVDLIKAIDEKYPYVSFTAFETMLMNDFLNHLIAQNTIFVQAEKDSSIFVFRFLQESGYSNLLYNPSLNDYNLYWTKNSIIITDLISESPMSNEKSHEIVLEKMLVDICADKIIASTYSKSELPNIIATAKNNYQLDKARLLRYARRRNKGTEMKNMLEVDG